METQDAYDQKLERILREASRVFAEQGYHQASIRDIAAATDVSLSGLYYYFKSKEELLFLIQSHCFDIILDRLEDDLAGVAEPEARLRVVVRNHLHFFVNNMAEMKVLSHEADSLSGEYRERVTEQKRAYADDVYGILETLAPDEDPVDLRVAVFSLFGMMNWIYNWYRPDRDVPVEQLVDEMLHVFLRGYRTPGVRRAPTDEESADESSIWMGGA